MGFYDDEDEDGIPECHGDEDYYDDTDRTCKDCNYARSCALKVRRISNKTPSKRSGSFVSSSRRNTSVVKSTKSVPTKNPEVVIEEDDDATFTGALVHNASIEAMQAMVDELANSIRHIPRKSYKNTWKRKKE